ncbi:putative protein of unknown function (DUF3455) [Lyophyllum shimeji]|uniref:Malate dehydrogenase n=1 Tax=Lyophyllum shimeji TaxID=47721 RepID=A0A9P3PUE1_LYOSH|nr:putative protein of unknown function (DUF3455) [Lyophyllum shimeji]
MLATTLISLALASCALAAPSVESKKRASCDISKATIAYPQGQSLPAPTHTPSYIAIALGTQNYTCSSAGTYTNVGALAELFDIACLYNTPVFANIQDSVYDLWKFMPPAISAQSVITSLHGSSSPAILGQHYYVTNPVTGTGASPKWDFTSQGATKGNVDAYVVAAKSAGITAPTGKQDVDWVQLKAVTGKLAAEIYRVDTRGGQPPATCTPGESTVVKYVAKYWLLGSSL